MNRVKTSELIKTFTYTVHSFAELFALAPGVRLLSQHFLKLSCISGQNGSLCSWPDWHSQPFADNFRAVVNERPPPPLHTPVHPTQPNLKTPSQRNTEISQTMPVYSYPASVCKLQKISRQSNEIIKLFFHASDLNVLCFLNSFYVYHSVEQSPSRTELWVQM